MIISVPFQVWWLLRFWLIILQMWLKKA